MSSAIYLSLHTDKEEADKRGETNLKANGRVLCVLDYEAGDPGSIPGSGGTTDWLFSAGW